MLRFTVTHCLACGGQTESCSLFRGYTLTDANKDTPPAAKTRCIIRWIWSVCSAKQLWNASIFFSSKLGTQKKKGSWGVVGEIRGLDKETGHKCYIKGGWEDGCWWRGNKDKRPDGGVCSVRTTRQPFVVSLCVFVRIVCVVRSDVHINVCLILLLLQTQTHKHTHTVLWGLITLQQVACTVHIFPSKSK